jgi:hypothetical protein
MVDADAAAVLVVGAADFSEVRAVARTLRERRHGLAEAVVIVYDHGKGALSTRCRAAWIFR